MAEEATLRVSEQGRVLKASLIAQKLVTLAAERVTATAEADSTQHAADATVLAEELERLDTGKTASEQRASVAEARAAAIAVELERVQDRLVHAEEEAAAARRKSEHEAQTPALGATTLPTDVPSVPSSLQSQQRSSDTSSATPLATLTRAWKRACVGGTTEQAKDCNISAAEGDGAPVSPASLYLGILERVFDRGGGRSGAP